MEYQIYNCKVVVAHVSIECVSLESRNNVNRYGLRWSVKIENQISIPSVRNDSQYGIPDILNFSNHINMSTAGNESVYIYGSNFGPVSALSYETYGEYVWYGPLRENWTVVTSASTTGENKWFSANVSNVTNATAPRHRQRELLASQKSSTNITIDKGYTLYNCKVVVSHTTMQCTSAESKNNILRTGLKWIVQIEDQTSLPSVNNDSQYGIPEILNLSNHINMNTIGNETIHLFGKNFGPVSVLSNEGPYNEYVWYGVLTCIV